MRSDASKSPRAHIIFWVAFLSFKIYHEYVFTLSQYDSLTKIEAFESSFIAQGGMLPVRILFSYWLIYWLMPRSDKNLLKWILFLIGFAVAIVIHRLMVVYIVLPYAYSSIPEVQELFSLERVASAMVDIATAAGIAAMLVFYARNKAAKEREARLEKEKVVAELQFLKNQTNPHFLFNTLNNLYALARKQSEKTPQAILQLSKFMRFVLYDTNQPTISLQEEIQMIENYISLERLRFGERIKVNFEAAQGLTAYQISPLILLPLVENAFKHGASEMEENGFINIRLAIENGSLHFSVENSFNPVSTEANGGIGLSNLKRQLDLQYPGHELSSSSKDDVYSAVLNLNLSEND
ncbi:MAG: histidine kinase [Roseivirga sp.]|nr:histidine kinase [Roseivirga sp.]